MWEDAVISIMQWVFIIALFPTIFHNVQKPAFVTSFTNVVGIGVVTAAYVSLGLWYSAFGAFVLGVGWATLAYQRYSLNRERV